jgi:hypothetical protein
MGNAFETAPEELRNSEAFVGLRRALMEGRPNEFCQNCGNLREIGREHAESQIAAARAKIAASTTLGTDEKARLGAIADRYADAAAGLE